MKRHAFDPFSFVLGLAFAALGLFFLVGDRTAADIGWDWMWPIPLVILGLLSSISAGRRLMPARGGARGRGRTRSAPRRGSRTRTLVALLVLPVGFGVGGRPVASPSSLARRRFLGGWR